MSIVTTIKNYVPNIAKNLIWDVFFASRNRGISLESHYPWISDDGVVCISISNDSNKCLGCLVVKKKHINNYGNIGMVGLVCIEPSAQGQGYSKTLLYALTDLFESEDIRALVLWTSKKRVYSAVGFLEDEIESFYLISRGGNLSHLLNVEENAFFVEETTVGMPAFANSIVKVTSRDCEITLLKTPSAFTLAAYTGSVTDVCRTLCQILPDGWFFNAKADFPMLNLLKQNGYSVEEKMRSSRMHLKKCPQDLLVIPEIALLDRV